jgi:hypothetical protein
MTEEFKDNTITLDAYRSSLAGISIKELDRNYSKDCVLNAIINMDRDGSGWIIFQVIHAEVVVCEQGAFSTATRRYWEIVYS